MDFSKVKEWQIPEGKVASVSVGGVVIWQAKTQAEQLTAPTISLDGDTLTMTATDDRTQEFVIFVDGVEMATVEVPKEETYTVSGTWRFNKTLTLPDTAIKQRVKGIFNDGTSFDGFNIRPTEVIEWDGYTNNTTLYADGAWTNEAYRTITFDGTQTVSKEFYEWLVANAKRPISGTWKWVDPNDFADYGDSIHAEFTSNNTSYDSIIGWGKEITYGTPTRKVYNTGSGWVNDNYQYITLNGTQYLYDDEYRNVTDCFVFAFTIDGTTYYAKEGMTWSEWVESEYSNNNYEIVDGGYVRHKPSIGQVWVKDDNRVIYSTQLIQNGVAYKHGEHSGGSN